LNAEKGLSHVVLEKGALVDAIRRFPVNMVFFTTPELLEIGELPLTCSGEKPTRLESLKYYRRVAAHYRIPLRLYERVRSVKRANGSFNLESSYERGQEGTPQTVRVSSSWPAAITITPAFPARIPKSRTTSRNRTLLRTRSGGHRRRQLRRRMRSSSSAPVCR
jgi:hypothetical protein